MKSRMIHLALALPVLTLSACGTPNPPAYSTAPEVRYSNATAYGTVESIEVVRARDGAPIGAIAGGVVGGLLGHQIGSGRGNTAATIGGAVGGAYVGNEIQQRNNREEAYRVTIRYDDGGRQTFTQAALGNVRVGDRVRVEDGRVY